MYVVNGLLLQIKCIIVQLEEFDPERAFLIIYIRAVVMATSILPFNHYKITPSQDKPRLQSKD